MKVLIACDKFKGSLSAVEVCRAIAMGIADQDPTIDISIQPIADGGDGTMILLKELLKLDTIVVDTIDPLDRPISAEYYVDDSCAYIELAEASGITRLSHAELDVMNTTTLGTGILIADAIDRGYDEIVLGLGGSCTNDAGLGIAYQLGYRFLGMQGDSLIPCGGNLQEIMKIIAPAEISKIRLKLLCDVKNPLYGSSGAAHTYAAQKGASVAQILELDKGLQHISQLVESLKGIDIGNTEGGGAAGGIAAGLMGLYNATSQSGFDFLMDITGLDDKIKESDLIISGEGRLDDQSIQGKVVGRLTDLCKKYQKPLIVVAGDSTVSLTEAKILGIQQIHTILSRAHDLADAMEHTEQYLIEIGSELLI